MTIPSMKDFFLPCLALLRDRAKNARDCLPHLQEEFRLTDAEMAETIPSGGRTRVFDRADWAIFHLMKAGLVDRPARGIYKTSDEGALWLDEGRASPTLKELKELPGYVASEAERLGGISSVVSPATYSGSQPAGDESPEERLAVAHAEIEAALAEELLALVRAMDPTRFESVILDLLNKMGYGAGHLSSSLTTAVTGDGGIDGIIHEDALGLDAVYIQAKRYKDGNTVGSAAIREFVGSLAPEGVTKGVFVTSSSFSRDARDYASRVSQRIVLIDGPELARLMIRHEVGTRRMKEFFLRATDENYFSEMS